MACMFCLFSVFLDGLNLKEELLGAVCKDVCQEIERLRGEVQQSWNSVRQQNVPRFPFILHSFIHSTAYSQIELVSVY